MAVAEKKDQAALRDAVDAKVGRLLDHVGLCLLEFSSKASVRSKYCDAALGPSWEGVPEEARFSMESSPSPDKRVVLMQMSG